MTDLNFACTKIPFDQIVRCGFGITKTDFLLLEALMTHDNRPVQELADAVGKERSTVQKSISRLLEKGIIERRQKNLGRGGYIFVYHIHDKADLKERIGENFRNWSERFAKELDGW
ncbi:winged helix-turn-helix transcriptional regulator [Candidatus Woesearchaeota archaeon]|nr:winged helix-turn-helix transcriptional regulator [Candidatus Woesearchaeota archaeon]